MISIEADFSFKELEDDMQAELDKWFDALLEVYRKAGKNYVDRARAKTKAEGGFGNITWNLRGSIGYVLVKEGSVIETYFPPISKGSEGLKIGEDFARELALLSDEGDDIMLVVVAGMEYASYVQATERDVIRGSSLFFENEVKAIFKQ